ncbi:cytochrome C biogenesis protein [Kiloniella spongiae]|uniref:Cytochrome c-type biogenesis protein n=1 Tax=Kiloniella spongiae TaxID=1489064 RepID=A0A0H2MIR0_9PROT|nr:cytochrome c-type biogenesis protein [Kiloniella spongiae]KLN60642.1 cytochrome C biogenesis protein [Kiloniella spongiae]
MRGLFLFAAVLLIFTANSNSVKAFEPDEILDDPALEARAREISKEVRCLVCQNEPIDSSNADLAKELRIVVRERLVAGDSDDDVKSYLSARYGDFVLFRPPFNTATFLLWFGPLLVFGVGGIGLIFFYRGNKNLKVAKPLSPEEEARFNQFLDEDKKTKSSNSGETS